MANQPPTSRPWLRLPTIGRQAPQPPPAPEPAPAARAQPQPPAPQQPRIPTIRPAFAPAAPAPAAQPPAPQQLRVPIIRPAFTPTFRPAFTQSQPAPPQPPSVAPAQPPTAASSPPPPPPPRPAIAIPPPSVASTAAPFPPPAAISFLPVTRSSESFLEQSSAKSSINADLSNPAESPKAIEPVTQSSPAPRFKTTSIPPSIGLPSSQYNSSKGILSEDEQKNVLVQETLNKQVIFPASKGNSVKGFGSTHNNSSKHGRSKEPNGRKPSNDSENGRNVRIITMTGENKGALMELGFPWRRNKGGRLGHWGNPHGNFYVSEQNVDNDAGESDGYNSGNADWPNIKDRKGIATTPSHQPMNAYVNSNVQGVNGSILYNCSYTHHDPGVHFSLSRKPINGYGKGSDHGIPHKVHANREEL